MPAHRARRLARAYIILPVASVLFTGSLTAGKATNLSHAAPHNVSATSCTLNVPTRYAISSPYFEVKTTLGADCAAAGVVDARWEARRSTGAPMYQLFFQWDYPDTWNVFDDDNLQVWTWTPTGATTSDDSAVATNDRKAAQTPGTARQQTSLTATIPQNTPTTDVRMMSKVDALPTDPAECSAEIWAQRYAIAPAGLINYGGRTGSVQQLNTSSGGWYVIASFTTGSDGHWHGPLPHTWDGTVQSRRVVVYDGQYIFGSISPTYTGTVLCDGVAAPSSTKSKSGSLGITAPKLEPNKERPGPLNPPPNR